MSDYWTDMPLEKFLTGYVEPHLLKAGLEGDLARAQGLAAALTCLRYGIPAPDIEIIRLLTAARKLAEEGHHKGAKVCLEAATRLGDAK